MHRLVVPHAGRRVKGNPVVGMAAAAVALANLARCTPLFVRTVATRLRCHSSPEATNPSIAVIAINPRGLTEVVTVDRVGNVYE